MKLVIKGPFTALRVNRALVGLPPYLPSSRMWFEKIEFKGVRWSLKWLACWCWSQIQEEPLLRGLGWGHRALGLGVMGCPETRAGGGAAEGGAQRILCARVVSGPGLATPLFSFPLGSAGQEWGKAAGAFPPQCT